MLLLFSWGRQRRWECGFEFAFLGFAFLDSIGSTVLGALCDIVERGDEGAGRHHRKHRLLISLQKKANLGIPLGLSLSDVLTRLTHHIFRVVISLPAGYYRTIVERFTLALGHHCKNNLYPSNGLQNQSRVTVYNGIEIH